jgi:alkylation response protein AidB-like acyl-CoA dehydrogenase
MGGGDPAAALRAELRGWLAEHLTDDVVAAGRRGGETDEDLAVLRRWNRQLHDGGWAAPAWPVEHGGRGVDVDGQLAYLEEMAAAEAPGPVNVIGVANIAPAIMAFGTDAQRQRFLRPLLRGDEIWCQGMSEPDAGSDLAGLRTEGRVVGDRVVVNGQKTWTSLARHADWCQLYVRTDPSQPRHRGISCLLVDMRAPGIEVRPITTMTGDRTFAEVYFTDVEVPLDALLGPLHGGWQVAMGTLGHERAGVAKLHLSLGRTLQQVRQAARATGAHDDPVRRQQLAGMVATLTAMGLSTRRALAHAAPPSAPSGSTPSASAPSGSAPSGSAPSAVHGSAIKVAWARATQRLAELGVDVVGMAAVAHDRAAAPVGSAGGTDGSAGSAGGSADGSGGSDGSGGPPDRWARALTGSRAASIAGGTTEVNLNVVAEHGLGLPR